MTFQKLVIIQELIFIIKSVFLFTRLHWKPCTKIIIIIFIIIHSMEKVEIEKN